MSYSGEVVEKRKLSNEEVISYLARYPINKVAMESSTYIVPIHRALTEKGHSLTLSVEALPSQIESLAKSCFGLNRFFAVIVKVPRIGAGRVG
jgi:hypothetical protein